MNDQQKFFVTQSKLKEIVRLSKIFEPDLSQIYETLRTLRAIDYLTENECNNFGLLSAFLKISDEQIMEFAERYRKSVNRNASSNSNYVFVSESPKYHKDQGCKTLRQDFENFEIPVEIKNQGESAISAFRQFAKENRKLLNEGREDVFRLRLKNQFKLQSDIGKILIPNSGKALLDVANRGENIEQLVVDIESIVNKMEYLRITESGSKAFNEYMFKPLSEMSRLQKINPEEQQLLDLRKALNVHVTEYVIKKQNGGQNNYSRQVLELFGFRPCGLCCADLIHFKLD